MITITQLIIGFSVISAAILLLAYIFFIKEMPKTITGMLACACLLVALSGLQILHWDFLQSNVELFQSPIYVFLLLAVPPSFFFFSREILQPDSRLSPVDVAHLLPLIVSFFLPTQYVVPLALAIGTGYSIWIARLVYGLRRHVSRFKFEMFFFAFFALLAMLVLILGLSSPYIDSSVFYFAYANFTGVALILVVAALISFPELLGDITDAARLTYAASTLKDVNTDQKLRQLAGLMDEDKIFQNESLNLAALAEAIELSSHQLSELINTNFGHGFSRYVREKRVEEAKRLLQEDSISSVLSISLTTGFRSQSNFYTAFKEVTGESPGDYRKRSSAS